MPAAPLGGPAGDAERSGPRLTVIVGVVLVGATLLVVATIGAVFGLSQLASGEDYTVGDCVVQEGSAAQEADCAEPEAFRIVSEVNDQSECPDPSQPTVELSGPPVQVYCLAPASDPESANPGGADPEGSDPEGSDPEGEEGAGDPGPTEEADG